MSHTSERKDQRSPRTDFEALAERAMERGLSRRAFLAGAASFGASAFVLGAGGLASRGAHAGSAPTAPHWLGFEPVAANSADTISVPPGFRWQTVISWGDPLWSRGSAFDPLTRGDAASQALAFGDNNDGMSLFKHQGRSILVVNNEYVNLDIMHGNRASKRPEIADDIRKSKAAHGVSVVEIERENGAWQPVLDSPFNRRITADTPMDITGPARGHDLL
ncbi:MAG: PhoX family protein, partial [Gammaproteobacteria bacterium]